MLEYIDRRYIWGLPCQSNFYETDIRAYERELLALRQALINHNFTQIHSYNTGTSISQENFAHGKFIAESAFIFIDYRDKDRLSGVSVMESGMFACIYLGNYDDEIPFARRLLDFCREQNWSVNGDYICEVMTEFNVFDGDKRNMFLKLQVPVKI